MDFASLFHLFERGVGCELGSECMPLSLSHLFERERVACQPNLWPNVNHVILTNEVAKWPFQHVPLKRTWRKNPFVAAKTKKHLTTFNGGSLGSCIDEERSQLRYVMWIAEPTNHRIFERKLRSWAHLGACLSECHVHLCSALWYWALFI